eukprot:gene36517-biopygen8334
MDTLPESVEVYRASPFLPPGHLGRVIRSGPPLTLSCCSPDPNHDITLCVLRTNHHLSWTPTLHQSKIPSKSTRPTNRVLLLTGILRGLWEPDPEADIRDLDICLPDQALVTSFGPPPESFSNEVAELLYEIAHLHLSSSRRVCHAATPGDLTSGSLTGPALGMALASAYAVSGLSQAWVMSPGSTLRGKRHGPTLSASTLT